jgi:RsiW-degrading membrane proteinase PrsW (M82 family)
MIAPPPVEPSASLKQPTPDRNAWLRILGGGLLLYAVALVVITMTHNPNLFPNVVLIGNFLVPVSYVAFFYQRRHLSQLGLPATVMAFFWGGLLGTLAAATFEPLFVGRLDEVAAFEIALIEELSKIIGVLVVARHQRHDQELDGLILGAAAGMGFAALESTGYAFTAFLASRGSLTETVALTLIRGMLAPLGHGTWTAILASVLFGDARRGHFRADGGVIAALLTVVLLHGMWDGLPNVPTIPLPLGIEVPLGQTLVAITSMVLLRRQWIEGVRRQEAAIRESTDAGELSEA